MMRLVVAIVVPTVLLCAGCAVGGPATRTFPARGYATRHRPAATPRSAGGGSGESLPVLGENAALEDYLSYAALGNPGLEAAFNRWQAALEKVPQARALPYPRLTYARFIREVETRVGPQQQKIGISQMFPWFGKLRLRGDLAAEEAKAARQRYEAEKLKLFYGVKEAYCEYYYLGQAIAIVRDERELVKYLEEVVRTRYKTATAEHADVIRAQVELAKLDDRLRTLQDLRGPVAARLNAALNRPISAPLPWPTEIAEESVEVTYEQLAAWCSEANPELRELQHAVDRERHAIQLARKEYWPDITVGLDYVQTGPAIMDTPESGKDPVMAMVSVTLPIWYGKLHAGVRQAEARHRAAARAHQQRENVLGARIKMALYRFQDAERKIDLYRDTLVPKGRQSVRASETAFRAGKASFLDVIDAIRILLEFELSHERALADRAQRLAELEGEV